MDAIKAIYSRYSERNFDESKTVSDNDLQTVLNAGMTAPVGRKRYDTLRLTVIRDTALLDEITQRAGMATPERPKSPFYGAKTLIVVSSTLYSADHIEVANAACIIENMAVAATALGLSSVYLWAVIKVIKEHNDLLFKLRLPEGYVPLSSLAVGYAMNPPAESDLPRHTLPVDYV